MLLAVSTLLLSGCWSSHEVNTLAISVCLGIDKSEKGYMVTEQVITPKVVASKRPSSDAPVVVYSSEGKNLDDAIRSFSSLVSREIYSSHIRMIILSEEVAREGISGIIDYLLRYHEYRTDFYFAIARGSSARDIMSLLTPLEAIPGLSMFHKQKLSNDLWAPVKAMKITELANLMISGGNNPVISGIEITEEETVTNSTDVLKQSGSDFKKLRYSSLGVLSGDKLIGWFDENESKGYRYITGTLKYTSGYASYGESATISYEVLNADSKIKPSMNGEKPKIDVSVKIEYDVTGVSCSFDVFTPDNKAILNRIAEEKIKMFCEQSISKAKELKSDIFGFGEHIHSKYPAYWKTAKGSWTEEFAELPVSISVKAKITGTGDISKPLPEKGKG